MRNFIRALVLMPAMALSACGGGGSDGPAAGFSNAGTQAPSHTDSGGGPGPVELGEEFPLRFGSAVQVATLSLDFTAVEDSRCGVGSSAVCAWEGNASIIVSATNGQISQMLVLNSNSKFSTSAVFAGHVIELRRLDPQPSFSDTGKPADEEYTATLIVDGVVVVN